MARLDFRSRSDAEVTDVSVDEFCTDTLPERLDETGPLAARAIEHLRLRPLAVDVGGSAYTFRPTGGTVRVEDGAADDAAVVHLDAEGFSDLVQEQRTATSFLTAGDANVTNGSIFHFVEWDPVLRAMVDGRPVHEPGMVAFHDASGGPLDLRRAFTPDDDDEEMAHFLAEAGFLLLRGWFDPGDMATISDDIDAASPTYQPDDGRSWWAKTADGENRLVRLQHFVEHSSTTASLLDDERHLRICGLSDSGHRRGQVSGNIIEALVKPIGIVEGISDVPWHKDCALGRHAYGCAGITVGISVTGSDEETGQLCVVPGSHRASVRPMGKRDDLDLPVLPLPTQSGDATVHLSCTLHMAMPPKVAERKVMYTGFGLPPRSDDSAGRAKLSRIREGAPKTISQEPGYTGD